MANVIVTEYASIGSDTPDRNIQAPHVPSLATQVVAISGTSAATTNAFNASTCLVGVKAEAACSVIFAASPTATASTGTPLGADETQHFHVTPGSALKLACIERTVS